MVVRGITFGRSYLDSAPFGRSFAYRVFITDLSYEHSIFLCINRFPQYVGAGYMPALLFYADLVTYSTATPFRVSAL